MLSVCMGSLTYGCILLWPGPVLPQLETGTTHLGQLSSDQLSWVASVHFVGALLGSLLPSLPFFPSSFHRLLFFTTSLLAIAGWLITGSAPNYPVLCLGRFLLGICGSLYTTITPKYIASIAGRSSTVVLCNQYIVYISVKVTPCVVSSSPCSASCW